MQRLIYYVFIFLIPFSSYPQEKKVLTIKRTSVAPKVDGDLNDAAWQEAIETNEFTQFRPEIGALEKEHQKTYIKMTYNDEAIFISAYLHDNPEDIMKQFTSRDNFGQSDFFGVLINPNNDGQNDTEFFVFSSGTQADAVVSSGSREDFGWNAVWSSAVKIVEDGWIVEMKIPYSALRFSNEPVQTWGINFHRHFRGTKSQYSWSPIDPTKGYGGLYHGEIKGIENIEPPTRLSFYPFASTRYETFDGESIDKHSVGLDVKYGISENFTLDATLIPDFSQAAFDNLEVNLSPFEQQFSEQRQFFKEGVDLFNKGGLFYSRRIGSNPVGLEDTNDNLGENEEVTNTPENVKMLNAIKFSGRTKKGLGIGFFNAITEKTEAEIKDNVTEESRVEVVEPLANYNVFVLDQQFNNNSSISLINTNVTRNGNFRDANVTGLLADIKNRRNTYGFEAKIKMSSLNLAEGKQNGFSSEIEVGKISGNFQYEIEHKLVNDLYDINDFGIQTRNNFSDFKGRASYRIFNPTEKLNTFRINVTANYNRHYAPSRYAGNNFKIDFQAQTKKLIDFGGNINTSVGKQYDFYESRENKVFIFKNWLSSEGWISTNFNKVFAVSGRVSFGTLFDNERDLFNYSFRVSPRIRFNDKFIFNYSFNYDHRTGNRGYVTKVDDDIIFGERNQNVIINNISGNYNFNTKHVLSLTFRNYWSTVTYDHDLFKLQDDGSLSSDFGYTVSNIDNPNLNFNIWNFDLKYAWEFAPGSQLIALYRNQLMNDTNASKDDYFKSLNNLFNEPIQHVFSLRLIYYIDYNNLKKTLSHKTS